MSKGPNGRSGRVGVDVVTTRRILEFEAKKRRLEKQVAARGRSLAPAASGRYAAMESFAGQGSAAERESGVRERADALASVVASGRQLVVAAILGTRSRDAFAPEADIVDLHPESWQHELETARPDLLLVESTREDDRHSWHEAVHERPQALVDIVQWCHTHRVATVFWSNDERARTDRQIKVAELFDHVFATDVELVRFYRRALHHGRVHVLPFASQPLKCNPIEERERKHAAVLVGGSYAGQKPRHRDLLALVEGTSRVLPVETYDGNRGPDASGGGWPEPDDSLVWSSEPSEQTDTAYQHYKLALNLNTAKASQTMLAPDVFDLVASGTLVVSNFAQSLRVLLGELVAASNSADEIESLVRGILSDPEAADRRRVAGVRHVLRHHTYAHRFQRLLRMVTGVEPAPKTPRVGLVGLAATAADVSRWQALARDQDWVDVALVVVTDDDQARAVCETAGIPAISRAQATEVKVADRFAGVTAVGVLSPQNWYGPYYIEGMAGALGYASTGAIAKTAHFRALGDGFAVADAHQEYRRYSGAPVPWHRALVRLDECADMTVAALADPGGRVPGEISVTGIDRFDYCEGPGALAADPRRLSADVPFQLGATIDAIEMAAADPSEADPREEIPADSFPADIVSEDGSSGCIVRHGEHGVVVGWILPKNKTTYIPFRRSIPVSRVATDGRLYLDLRLHASRKFGVNVSWLGADGGKIAGRTYHRSDVHEITVPDGAQEVLLFLSASGAGAALIEDLSLSPRRALPRSHVPLILEGWASSTLIISPDYPAYDNLYRFAFVHTRAKAYQSRGERVDVFVPGGDGGTTHREFQGVHVMTGTHAALRQLLESGRYERVLVHFLDARMWSVLRDFVHRLVTTVWVHGAEIEPWWRRSFNFRTEQEIDAAKRGTDSRMELWREVSSLAGTHVKFVFVSHAFRGEVAVDQASRGFGLDDAAVRIIHNPIDTELFSYAPKDVEQRKRILLIRPFASRKYANDLATAAIKTLSSEPWFDELTFHLYGDGPLFMEDTAGLSAFRNVIVERRFLTQQEIAGLHKEFGVFLVPTRHDTQGVSRDEAMSSGLVPVTSDLPAVREFLSDDEGYIAPFDDAAGLADAIRDMYHHPEIFLAKSRAAAERIRRTVASDIVIPQEMATFGAAPDGEGSGR